MMDKILVFFFIGNLLCAIVNFYFYSVQGDPLNLVVGLLNFLIVIIIFVLSGVVRTKMNDVGDAK